MQTEKAIVEKAKKQFDKDFFTEGYTNIISDDEHLKDMINFIDLKQGGNYLDLGTGSGYVAFNLAKQPINVIGLDIVENTINRNSEIASEKQITNVKFQCYDGINIPYKREEFDGIVSRYAIHHFPDIKQTIKELSNIVKPSGQVLISDPTVNKNDEKRFVDKYMQLRDDGHVKFYHEDEFVSLFKEQGFQLTKVFYNKIRFPRTVDSRYYKLTESYDDEIVKSYDITVEEDKIYITLNVLNLLFEKI